jgi:hypothetical protein
MGHEGGQGGGASPGDLKLSGVMLGAKEKVGGDKVENQELGAESLQRTMSPCPLQLHALRHHACAGLPSTCTFSFFFFLLTPSFAVQSPRSHCHLC